MAQPEAGYIRHLYDVILTRRGGNPETSYVAKKFAKGRAKIAQKVGEEAVEVAIAAVQDDRVEIINESGDLLFHWLILLADAGIAPEEVFQEMQRREGISGLDEKASREKKE